MAPEIIKRESYDNRVDIWALGVLATELVTGHTPFTAYNKEQLYEKVLKDEPNLQI